MPLKRREYTASGQQVVGIEKLIVIHTDVTGERRAKKSWLSLMKVGGGGKRLCRKSRHQGLLHPVHKSSLNLKKR